YEHWGVDRKRGQIVESFFKRFGCRLSDDVLAKVHSIEFGNSICIVRKNKVERNILNRRVVAGSVATVKPVRNLPPQSSIKDQSCNEWATEMLLEERIIELCKRNDEAIIELRKLRSDLQKRQKQITKLRRKLKKAATIHRFSRLIMNFFVEQSHVVVKRS